MDGLEASAAEMLALARAAGDRRLEGRAHELYANLNMAVDPEAGKANIAAGFVLAEESGDGVALLDLALIRGMIAMRADDTGAALGYVDDALVLCETHGNHYFQSWNLAIGAIVATRLGSLHRAREAADQSITLLSGMAEAVAPSYFPLKNPVM
jgi:hypothetical protein